MTAVPIKNTPMLRHVLSHVRRVKETGDMKEVAQLLSTGEWIALSATPGGYFCLGKIED